MYELTHVADTGLQILTSFSDPKLKREAVVKYCIDLNEDENYQELGGIGLEVPLIWLST